MDLLSSLNFHILPEQQTRINNHISSALKENPKIRLGFDSCCNCAKTLKNSDKEDTCCKGCRRVWYCSKTCRKEDADLSSTRSMSEEDQANGHSPIVCSLLRLCTVDEEVEENNNMVNNRNITKNNDDKKSKNKITFSEEEKRAAFDRISSEHESYPATLNVLMDAPYFEATLDKFMVKRRGKRKRQIDLDESENDHHHDHHNTLTIHVIGASKDAELWGDFKLGHTDAISAYTEVFSELVSTYRKLQKIILAFVGPNCPKENIKVVKYIDDVDVSYDDTSAVAAATTATSSTANEKKRKRHEGKHGKHCQVVIETHCHNYELKYFKSKESHPTTNTSSPSKKKDKHSIQLTKPDIVVFFNPGFTCPDYEWHEALKACQDQENGKETPFIVTTNTEMEAIADIQYLHQNGYIESLPPVIADILNEGQLDHDSDAFDQNENNSIFFGENVNAGSRVRQSGNMANDLFCKNKYIIGGHFSNKKRVRSNSTNSSVDIINKPKLSKDSGGKTDHNGNNNNNNKNNKKNSSKSNAKKGNFALM